MKALDSNPKARRKRGRSGMNPEPPNERPNDRADGQTKAAPSRTKRAAIFTTLAALMVLVLSSISSTSTTPNPEPVSDKSRAVLSGLPTGDDAKDRATDPVPPPPPPIEVKQTTPATNPVRQDEYLLTVHSTVAAAIALDPNRTDPAKMELGIDFQATLVWTRRPHQPFVELRGWRALRGVCNGKPVTRGELQHLEQLYAHGGAWLVLRADGTTGVVLAGVPVSAPGIQHALEQIEWRDLAALKAAPERQGRDDFGPFRELFRFPAASPRVAWRERTYENARVLNDAVTVTNRATLSYRDERLYQQHSTAEAHGTICDAHFDLSLLHLRSRDLAPSDPAGKPAAWMYFLTPTKDDPDPPLPNPGQTYAEARKVLGLESATIEERRDAVELLTRVLRQDPGWAWRIREDIQRTNRLAEEVRFLFPALTRAGTAAAQAALMALATDTHMTTEIRLGALVSIGSMMALATTDTATALRQIRDDPAADPDVRGTAARALASHVGEWRAGAPERFAAAAADVLAAAQQALKNNDAIQAAEVARNLWLAPALNQGLAVPELPKEWVELLDKAGKTGALSEAAQTDLRQLLGR